MFLAASEAARRVDSVMRASRGGRLPAPAWRSPGLEQRTQLRGRLRAESRLDPTLRPVPERRCLAQRTAAGIFQRHGRLTLVRAGHEPHQAEPLQQPDVAPYGRAVELGHAPELG